MHVLRLLDHFILQMEKRGHHVTPYYWVVYIEKALQRTVQSFTTIQTTQTQGEEYTPLELFGSELQPALQ